MQLIITQPDQVAHANTDATARLRADRLAKATVAQMQGALAFLSMIDPEAFDIAFTGVSCAAAEEGQDPEAEPLCRTCAAPVAIFPELSPAWQHYRGERAVTERHEVYDPGHAAEVGWYDLDDMPDDF
ncbi:MAG: hypothetical protein ACRDYB_14835 [Acidimicrobiales bacterium]